MTHERKTMYLSLEHDQLTKQASDIVATDVLNIAGTPYEVQEPVITTSTGTTHLNLVIFNELVNVDPLMLITPASRWYTIYRKR